MDPWFHDLPLDFSREDTRRVESILIRAYPMNRDALKLAQNAGLDLASLDQMAPVKYLVPEILQHARSANRLLRLLAEVMGDGEQEAYQEKLWPLLAGAEAQLSAAILKYRPSLSLLAAVPPSIALRQPGAAPVALAKAGLLEKITNAAAGFSNITEFRRGLAAAEVRTARILVGGHANGTGFLVGESLLLTNWHVVAGGGSLTAQFDHRTSDSGASASDGRKVAFAADWRVAFSGHASLDDEIGPDGPEAKTWDYALVRLAEPVGKQPLGPDPKAKGDARGYYTLDGEHYAFQDAEPILIVGHPMARPMELSYASPSGAKLTAHENRVRYQTNTEGGSSGSPVFNKDWRIVALHHAGGPSDQPGPLDVKDGSFNQGVPIADILADLQAQLADRPAVLDELKGK